LVADLKFSRPRLDFLSSRCLETRRLHRCLVVIISHNRQYFTSNSNNNSYRWLGIQVKCEHALIAHFAYLAEICTSHTFVHLMVFLNLHMWKLLVTFCIWFCSLCQVFVYMYMPHSVLCSRWLLAPLELWHYGAIYTNVYIYCPHGSMLFVLEFFCLLA